MKVYIVTHYIDCEYDNIEKVFSSKEKAEEYQELMREKYKCPRYYTSRKGEKLYITEDFYVDEYEVESSADRPRGEWIEVLFNEKIKYMVCSECGNRYAVDLIVPLEAWIDEKHRFCSLCGADMRKESE